MGFEGKKNVYVCRSCGHGFVSQDVDEGVTPFATKCLNCDSLAESFFYRVPQEFLGTPAVEWYKPSNEELGTLSEGVLQHVSMGGLIRRVL